MTGVPPGYVGVVVADTRRALEWERGLRAAGFDVVRVETSADDADKGSWRVCVARHYELEAKSFVTDVIRGDARLPARPYLSRAGWLALIGVFVTIGVAFAVALMSCERRAEPREPGSIEPVMQETWTDCGPAAVTMSLTVHGRDATLASVKKAMPAQEDGVTAFDIVELAKKEGMGAVGIRIDVSEAASVLQLGDILHVNASHFVVFEQFDTEGFHVLDPSEGRRTAPLSDFANEFSGVALLFADSPAALEARLARHRFP